MKPLKIGKKEYAPAAGPVIAVRRLSRTLILSCLAALALGACAATSTATRDRDLPQRAQARWDALLAGDYASAYAYLTPGYRSSTSVTDFEIAWRSRRVQYNSAEYREHHCAEAACNVVFSIGYGVVRPAAGVPEWKSTSVVEERWIYTAGEWWFSPEK